MAEMGFTVTCPAFHQGTMISATHTCDGRNISPALRWSHTPPNTGSFVLLMEDRDAPDGVLTHWVLFDIPSLAEGLAEQEASLGLPGRNDFQHEGYTGPCPPPRGSAHRYALMLYALDVESLGLPRGATRRQVEYAMRSTASNVAGVTYCGARGTHVQAAKRRRRARSASGDIRMPLWRETAPRSSRLTRPGTARHNR